MSFLLLSFSLISTAQSDEFELTEADGIQEFRGSIADAENDDVLIYLDNLQAGDTIYAIAKGADDLDPYLILTDENFSTALAEDDDSGGDLNAALSFTVADAGNYVLGMFSISGIGDYVIVAGINQPAVLRGETQSGAQPPAVSQGTAVTNPGYIIEAAGEITEFAGVFASDSDEVLVDLPAVQAGDTIYVYASGLGSVDTYIYVLGSNGRVLAEDDDSGGGYNSFLEFPVETSGDYTIGLITISAAGNYRLLIGVNTPDLLDSVNQPDAAGLPANPEGFDCSTVTDGERPTLSGATLILDGESFRIHYTLTGTDAATQEYVDDLAVALQRSLDTQLNDLGWALPPADCGEGGDSRLDVYVVDMSDDTAIGYASPENVVGDNPNTDAEEFYSAYSYLAIENDMEFVPRRQGFELMRTTAAHEIHHIIQFGYDVNDRFFGFYEAGASWIETLVYPTQTNSYEYVDDVFAHPDVCIGSTEHEDDLRIYGEWLMVDSLTRDLGLESYQFIWEYMASGEGLRGFYNALSELDTTPQEVIQRTGVRNLLYNYALAKRFASTVDIEATINGTGTVEPRRDGVQQLGVDYLRIAEAGTYTFSLGDAENLLLYVIGIDSETGSAAVYELGTEGTVNTTSYDYAYVMILNTQEHTSTTSCRYTPWSLAVSDGKNDPQSQPTDEIWDASQFVEAR